MMVCMKDYNLNSFQEKDLYTWDEIVGKFEDLEAEVEEWKEKYEDSENDKESNYRHLTPAELIDWSDRW